MWRYREETETNTPPCHALLAVKQGKKLQIAFTSLCATASAEPVNPAWRNVTAARCPRTRRVLRCRQGDILNRDVVARVYVRAADAGGTVALLIAAEVTGEVDKGNVADIHQARASIAAVVAAALRDRRSGISPLDQKVGEEDVADAAPATTARKVIRLVGCLRYEGADPSFDVGAGFHVLIVADDLCLVVSQPA